MKSLYSFGAENFDMLMTWEKFSFYGSKSFFITSHKWDFNNNNNDFFDFFAYTNEMKSTLSTSWMNEWLCYFNKYQWETEWWNIINEKRKRTTKTIIKCNLHKFFTIFRCHPSQNYTPLILADHNFQVFDYGICSSNSRIVRDKLIVPFCLFLSFL